MSYLQVVQRVAEIRERIGLQPSLTPGLGTARFDEVLATARSRFNTGPQRVNSVAEVADGPDAAAAVRARIRPMGGTPDASLARPSFATPARVNGWSPQLKQMVDEASQRFGVPRELVIAVSRAESAFRSDVTSPAGARGLMQLMPATARGLGVTDITDPWQNLAGGTKYLRQLMDRFDGDVKKVLAGYNAGPGAVERHGGVPPYSETRTYVARVLDYASELGFQPGAPTTRTRHEAA